MCKAAAGIPSASYVKLGYGCTLNLLGACPESQTKKMVPHYDVLAQGWRCYFSCAKFPCAVPSLYIKVAHSSHTTICQLGDVLGLRNSTCYCNDFRLMIRVSWGWETGRWDNGLLGQLNANRSPQSQSHHLGCSAFSPIAFLSYCLDVFEKGA